MRTVSLLPAATEVVCALGCGDTLVGRSHECDHPPEVARLPVCSAPRRPIAGDSATIHRTVQSLLRDVLSIYRVDTDVLAALRPDLIITQTLCAVCAVPAAEVEAAAAAVAPGVRVLALSPRCLDDVLADFRRIAGALGVPDRGAALAAAVADRIAAVRDATAGAARPRVLALEWLDPPMAGGNWMPELVAAAGGTALVGRVGEHSPRLRWTDVAALDPDVIVVAPCGLDLDRTTAELERLATHPVWSSLRAVREGRVHLIDGHAYVNRPGPRLADTTEILGALLHPDRVPAPPVGGWRRGGPH